jgi:hypothetical protein
MIKNRFEIVNGVMRITGNAPISGVKKFGFLEESIAG